MFLPQTMPKVDSIDDISKEKIKRINCGTGKTEKYERITIDMGFMGTYVSPEYKKMIGMKLVTTMSISAPNKFEVIYSAIKKDGKPVTVFNDVSYEGKTIEDVLRKHP